MIWFILYLVVAYLLGALFVRWGYSRGTLKVGNETDFYDASIFLLISPLSVPITLILILFSPIIIGIQKIAFPNLTDEDKEVERLRLELDELSERHNRVKRKV